MVSNVDIRQEVPIAIAREPAVYVDRGDVDSMLSGTGSVVLTYFEPDLNLMADAQQVTDPAITLPFAVPLYGRLFTEMRISESRDGSVVFEQCLGHTYDSMLGVWVEFEAGCHTVQSPSEFACSEFSPSCVYAKIFSIQGG